jgi:hypothetical protein
MPTHCNPALFDFAPVEGRAVVAGFDGGAITSTEALLLGQADRAIRTLCRPLYGPADGRSGRAGVRTNGDATSHGDALGYEGLLDHDQLRT